MKKRTTWILSGLALGAGARQRCQWLLEEKERASDEEELVMFGRDRECGLRSGLN